MKKSPINILVTINKNYINPLIVMLYSYIKNNAYKTNIYIMNKDLEQKDIDYIAKKVNSDLITIIDIKIDDSKLANAPVSKQFPITMYYRLFAHLYLPKNVNKVLYLDPDIIVDKDIMELYNLNINRFCYAGATHVKGIVKLFNNIRLGLSKNDPYINSGVLMINLNEIRKVKIKEKDIYEYIRLNKHKFCLPDQDVLSKVYAGRIKLIDTKIYNVSEKMVNACTYEWIEDNSKIIHYCGKNKPWNDKYKGVLNKFYNKYSCEIFN